ncbi:(2Fe-2S)-binding protein [Prescottella agglutinans]|uniref:(2Fe-2S)-binding protein n=1 Tax=Prescottella agglutinans TaxID=1644129 RepID=UPI003D986971
MDLQPHHWRRSSPTAVAATVADLATVGPYFTVTTGEPGPGPWRPVGRLYDDPAALAAVVTHVGEQIGAGERRVAASTLLMGYAARLWSLTLGAVVRGRLVLTLDPEELLWHENLGQIRLHVREPRGRDGGDLVASARETVLDRHLQPLIAAIRAAEPMSAHLLWGNVASALVGTAHVLDGETGSDAITVAEQVLHDPRLAPTLERGPSGYRRRSCCLFYRTAVSGYCGDCPLPRRK